MRWSLETVADAVGGRLTGVGDEAVTRVVTDSRRAGQGALFVAIEGERHDGHDFAAEALSSGSAGVVVREGRTALRPRIEVGDTLRALRDLGARRRDELAVPVAAVTGSTGKTGTKDLLAAALGPGAWAAPRSYNNEVGVPLTVLDAPDDTEVLVLEVGSRGRGHIAWLAPVVRPMVAVITNVGVAHLETFRSVEGVARAKWELVEALEPGGTAVLPADSRHLDERKAPRRFTFGTEPWADVRVEDQVLDEQARPSFRLRTASGSIRLHLSVAGSHQALNAAAAAAAGLALGRTLEELAPGLESATGSPWRMEISRGRFTVVNDAYNANPASMASALETVAGMPGRRVAVLGRMAELGPVAEEEHRRIGRMALDLGFEVVLVVGEDPGLAEGAGPAARKAADREEALELLDDLLEDGDVVLLKGSRVVGLEELADRLSREAGA